MATLYSTRELKHEYCQVTTKTISRKSAKSFNYIFIFTLTELDYKIAVYLHEHTLWFVNNSVVLCMYRFQSQSQYTITNTTVRQIKSVIFTTCCFHVDHVHFPNKQVSENKDLLECAPMPNVMVALPNIGAAHCSTPQFGWRQLLDCRHSAVQ